MTEKLFAVLRKDLHPGAKACQAIHAVRAYAQEYPFIEAMWWRNSNTIVLLETEDLLSLEAKAQSKGITCVRFVEPDWAPEGTLTALAFGPDAKSLLSSLPLAFS